MLNDWLTPFQSMLLGGLLAGAVMATLYALIRTYGPKWIGPQSRRIRVRYWSDKYRRVPAWREDDYKLAASVIFVGLVSTFVIGPFYFDYYHDGTVFFTADGQIVDQVDNIISPSRTYWESDLDEHTFFVQNCLSHTPHKRTGDPCEQYGLRVAYVPSAPITANPHVIWHQHQVTARRLKGAEQAVWWGMNVLLPFGSTQDFIRHHIIEMSRQNSELLLELDNPFPRTCPDSLCDQARYQEMARQYFEPILREVGMELISAEFSLNQPR